RALSLSPLFPYTTLFRSHKVDICSRKPLSQCLLCRGHGLSLLVRFAHCGVSRLMGLHYRSSHRRPFAIPAGQGGLRKHYIARRKLVCIFEESSPCVPINEVALRIKER